MLSIYVVRDYVTLALQLKSTGGFVSVIQIYIEFKTKGGDSEGHSKVEMQ